VKQCLYPGDALNVTPKDTINVLDIKTNIPTNVGVRAFLKGARSKTSLYAQSASVKHDIGLNHAGDSGRPFKIEVQREQAVLGSILLDFKKGARHGG
jgi:hypothetical protein